MGRVTMRDALTNSLNVATVKVAELIGYGRVVQIARQMGLGNNIRATPAVALGAYDMTPVDVAAGLHHLCQHRHARLSHKSFATSSVPMARSWRRSHRKTRTALDPRVAYLVYQRP